MDCFSECARDCYSVCESDETIDASPECVDDGYSVASVASATLEVVPFALLHETHAVDSPIESTQDFVPRGLYSRPVVMFCFIMKSFAHTRVSAQDLPTESTQDFVPRGPFSRPVVM